MLTYCLVERYFRYDKFFLPPPHLSSPTPQERMGMTQTLRPGAKSTVVIMPVNGDLWFEGEGEAHFGNEIWRKVFSCILKKIDTTGNFVVLFPPERLTRSFLLKEVKPSPERNMTKPLTFDNLFPHYDILAKSRGWMTVVSRQNDACSRARTT